MARNVELAGDFVVGVAQRDPFEHLPLAWRQRCRGGRFGRRQALAQPLEQLARDQRADRAAAVAQRADVAHDAAGLAVLEQVAAGAGLDGAQHVDVVAEHGVDHDAAVAPQAPRLPDDIDARAVGQAQVDQQHVGRRALQHGQRVGARLRLGQHGHAGLVRDRRDHGVAKRRVVLDDGDTQRSGRPRWRTGLHGVRLRAAPAVPSSGDRHRAKVIVTFAAL